MVAQFQVELDREQLERNWTQAELNRVKSFWDITKNDVDEKAAELRNIEGAVEGAEERHQLEIKVMSSACSHIIYIYIYRTRIQALGERKPRQGMHLTCSI